MSRAPATQALRERLVALLVEDWGLKLLSLVAALAIWTWIQSELVVDVLIKVEVRYLWPEGLLRLEEEPTTVTASVSGPQADVRRLESQKPYILVDLSEAREGKTEVDFSVVGIAGGTGAVKVLRMAPSNVQLHLEKRSSRKVPVAPVIVGEVPPGYRLVSARAVPASVEVAGPRSLVKELSQAPTDAIDVSELTASRLYSVPLALPNRLQAPAIAGPLQVAVDVEAIIAERRFVDVPVVADRAGWKATPPTVSVLLSGPAATLNALKDDQVVVSAHLPASGNGKVTLQKLGDQPGQLSVTTAGDHKSFKVKKLEPSSVVLEPEGR